MSHSGFQYNHPELTLDLSLVEDVAGSSVQGWDVFQRVVSGIALLILCPVFLILFVLVKTTSKGPFIFRQKRSGLRGKVFEVYKIRSMRRGTEAVSSLGVKNTSFHVTKVGKVLRVLKLDELPQLWNIVKGDMNVVGPRPIPLALNQKLSEEIPGFMARYQVKPGLTSIGQICIHDNELDARLVDDWKVRFEGELHYIRNRSVRYDLLMVVMTALYVLRKLNPLKNLKHTEKAES